MKAGLASATHACGTIETMLPKLMIHPEFDSQNEMSVDYAH